MKRIFSRDKGLLMSFAARVTAQGCGLFMLLYAARLLSTAEFGVYALASTSILLLSRLSEAGWSEIISGPGRTAPRLSHAAYVLALSAGVIATVIGLIAVATVEHHAWVTATYTDVAWILVLTVLPGCFIIVQYGHLLAQGKVFDIGLAQFCSEVCGFVVSFQALTHGHGILSLAYGRLTLVLVAAAFVAIRAHWFTIHWPGRSALLEAIVFTREIVYSRLTEFVRGYGIEYLIGAMLGSSQVAVYRVANRISGAAGELVFEPLRQQMWSRLPKVVMAGSSSAGREQVTELVSRSFAVLLPLYVFLSVAAHAIVAALLPNPEWAAVGILVAVMSIPRLTAPSSMVAEVIFSVNLATRSLSKLSLLSLFASILLPALICALQPTALSAAAGQSLAALLTTAWGYHMQKKHSNWSLREAITQCRPIAPALVLAAAITIAFEQFVPGGDPWYRLFAVSAIYFIIFSVAARRHYSRWLKHSSPVPALVR